MTKPKVICNSAVSTSTALRGQKDIIPQSLTTAQVRAMADLMAPNFQSELPGLPIWSTAVFNKKLFRNNNTKNPIYTA